MKKPIVQHALCILLMIIVAFAYNLPAFQGNELKQGDTIHWKSMSWEAKQWHDATGEVTLWSNSMFGGMPTATYAVFGSGNYIAVAFYALVEFLTTPFALILLAMIGFYVLAYAMRWNRWIGLIGGIAYAFVAYNPQIIAAGHNTKMINIALMPGVIAGIHLMFNKKLLPGSLILLLFLALTFNCAMYQIIYYEYIIIGGLMIYYFFQKLKEKEVMTFVLPAVLMVAITALSVVSSSTNFFFTQEYTEATMRGGNSELTLNKKEKKTNGGLDKDYAFAWSQGIGETFTLFAPNLYGGGSNVDVGTDSKTYEVVSEMYGEENAENFSKHTPAYWGPQPFLAGPNYFGAIIMFLMILGLFIIDNKMKWYLFAIGVIGIMMSWGRHFSGLNYFLFDHLPMYNKFRTPSMIMSIPAFTFMFIAVWGLHEFLFGGKTAQALFSPFKKSVILTGAICLMVTLGGKMFLDFRGENDDKQKAQLTQMMGGNTEVANKVFSAIVEDRSSIAFKDGLRSILLIGLVVLVLGLYTRNKLNPRIALVLVGLLISVDGISIAYRYLNKENYETKEEYEQEFAARPIDLEIKKDPDPYYRVYDLSTDTYNDAVGAVHHKLIGGYSPAKMEVYQDLIDMQLSGGKMNMEVLNMLNAKYIIFNGPDKKPTYQLNPQACGNAWFIKNVKLVNSADEEMLALNAANLGDTAVVPNSFRAKDQAIVNKKEWKNGATSFVTDSLSNIKLTKYGLNDLSYESNNSQAGFAVFSDIYYKKGWKAFIDDKETDIVKVNYLLRGLNIPSGKHQIKFVFQPESVTKWGKIGTYTSILIFILLGAGLVYWMIQQVKRNGADVQPTV